LTPNAAADDDDDGEGGGVVAPGQSDTEELSDSTESSHSTSLSESEGSRHLFCVLIEEFLVEPCL